MSEQIGKRPELTFLVHKVQRYTQEDILWSQEYREANQELGLSMGADKNGLIGLRIQQGILHGINETNARMALLPDMKDPQKRKKIVEQVKQGTLPSRWITRLAAWDTINDQYGLAILEQCKQAELEEIDAQRRNTTDEIEEIRLIQQRQAVDRGQNLVINYYKSIIE